MALATQKRQQMEKFTAGNFSDYMTANKIIYLDEDIFESPCSVINIKPDTKSNLVQIFDINDVDLFELKYKDAERYTAARVKNIVDRLRETAAVKSIAAIPPNFIDYCDTMKSSFPNFSSVLDFIAEQMALSAISDQALRLSPIMLIGPPGIGKSELALTIADDLKAGFEIIDIASAQTGSALTGSEAYWGNTQPGALFNRLVFGVTANPVIVLDEIDKPSTGQYNSLAGLYQLLEKRQARIFKDLSVPEIPINASNVCWIACGNNLNAIDQPILDRFTIFEITKPTREQMRLIVCNQYKKFIETHPAGSFFEPSIRENSLNELSKYHPRKARKTLDRAFGIAAIAKRNYLTELDIKAASFEREKNKIGFVQIT